MDRFHPFSIWRFAGEQPAMPKRRTVRAPLHPDVMSPSFARWMSVELAVRADDADGGAGPAGFVTRWEVLAELASLRSEVASLRERIAALA